MTPDGKNGGLPNKADNLINKTKDNAKIDRMKDALDGRLTPQFDGGRMENKFRRGSSDRQRTCDIKNNGGFKNEHKWNWSRLSGMEGNRKDTEK